MGILREALGLENLARSPTPSVSSAKAAACRGRSAGRGAPTRLPGTPLGRADRSLFHARPHRLTPRRPHSLAASSNRASPEPWSAAGILASAPPPYGVSASSTIPKPAALLQKALADSDPTVRGTARLALQSKGGDKPQEGELPA